MNLKNLAIVCLLAALTGLTNAATVSLTTVADTDVRLAAPTYAKGNRLWHSLKNVNDFAKLYVKFELPADFGTATDASFRITPNAIVNPAWYLPYNVHGLNDGAVGNDWQDLSPGEIPGQPYTAGLTWQNAPANNTASGDGFTSDATGVLGSFVSGGVAYDERTTGSSAALVNFLNTDTDGVVTLMVARTVTGTNSADQWISKEGAGGTYPGNPPMLDLSYIPIPEPATIALLGMGLLAVLRRRR